MRHILDHPLAYRAWQAPFIAQKVQPFRRHNADLAFRRVLDVGCGPGTNASMFDADRYVGVDVDRGYVRQARRRESRTVVVADAARLPFQPGPWFDCIFINSLLHHLSDQQVADLLRRASMLLMPVGQIHVIDLVVPPKRSIPRTLALRDRGRHPRSRPDLLALLHESIDSNVEEPFALRVGPAKLWQMIYVRGTPRGGR